MKPISIIGILLGAGGLFAAYTINEKLDRFHQRIFEILPRESLYREEYIKLAAAELNAVQIYLPYVIGVVSICTIYISIKLNKQQ